MNPERADASIGQLFGSLASDTSILVRQELQLATAEMTGKARIAARNAGLIAAAGLVLHLSGIAALAGVMAALQTFLPFLPLWATALILAAFLAVVGMVMMQVGMRALRELDPVPQDTLSTLRPDRV